ncbi:MAG: helix-turn-helix transcriptional regulator [Oscillospiraceae bacterium]
MPKSTNQKRKILYLMQILLEQTDEDHFLSLSQLTALLAQQGIEAERKSLYDDLEQLRQFGVDVEFVKGKEGGYHVPNRTFQLAELKLLVDSVQASKFITSKKSMELIKKLESLTSVHQARQLQRQVFVAGRIKAMNESVYYNVDQIHAAIGQNRQIGFRYFEYTVEKKRRFRHDGAQYRISPFALAWDDENYYMLGFDTQAGILKHYRVDKMTEIQILDLPREGNEQFRKLDLAVYSRKVFSMFGGEEEMVRLRFENQLIGVVMDRFGKDVSVFPKPDGFFEIYTKVALSPQFYGWVFALGEGARILSPEKAVRGMKEQLCNVRKYYEKEE